MTATVIKMSIQRMVCTSCGVEANASCNCGKPYVPKLVQASEAIKANPEKSNRAIADEIGADEKTVRKARADQSAPEKRVGKDGKQYPAKQAKPERSDEPEDTDDITPEKYVALLSDYWKLKDRNSVVTAALNAKEAEASRNWPAEMTTRQIKARDNCLKQIAAWQRSLEQLYGEVTGCPSWRVEVTTKDGRHVVNGVRLGTRGEAEFYNKRLSTEAEYASGEVLACKTEKANAWVIGDEIRFEHGNCVLFNWRPLAASETDDGSIPEFLRRTTDESQP
jgi:hypothetical protein